MRATVIFPAVASVVATRLAARLRCPYGLRVGRGARCLTVRALACGGRAPLGWRGMVVLAKSKELGTHRDPGDGVDPVGPQHVGTWSLPKRLIMP
jgi:hypothetical protein